MTRASGFLADPAGGVSVIFGIAAVAIIGVAGVAIDYSRALASTAQMQLAADSTALQLVAGAEAKTDAQNNAAALKVFGSAVAVEGVKNVAVTSAFDKAKQILTVTATAKVETSLTRVLGFKAMDVKVVSAAGLQPKELPICVLVTEPEEKHTFLVKNGAQVNFTGCMTQVNTANWDAVEGRDTAFIHSRDGENCFVGDIHHGDIQPPKSPTCTMYDDPFKTYAAPASAATCTYAAPNKLQTSFSPGTYCGGIEVTKSATFSPGLYVVKNGPLKVSGATTTVTANGVTFVFMGTNATLDIDTRAKFDITPASEAAAGKFAGFSFFRVQPAGNEKSTIAGATMSSSGIVYLAGQELNLTDGANVTLSPGTIVAGYILPDNAKLTLNGSMNTSTLAEVALRKNGQGRRIGLLK